MSKSQKELAFLHDLYVATDWTERFTDIFDANFKFSGEKNILYVNAGTGNHALTISENLEKDSNLNAFNEDEELNFIAQAKSDALKSDVYFAAVFPDEIFDVVVADASFVKPEDLSSFIAEIIDLSAKQVAFFLPTAGSFGEIFSFLWETLLDLDLLEKVTELEGLISEIPTVSKVKEIAENLGLSKIQTVTKTEVFEFENGTEFVTSPLAADFLLPVRLDFLDAEEQKQVLERFAQLIDADDGTLSFRFSIKATLVVGEKR
ncbi:MAG: hypothetical protein H0V31_07105 [Acidobacteria bacterium]|nr:hypothetical protein [Acidobacteriota bacterium]